MIAAKRLSLLREKADPRIGLNFQNGPGDEKIRTATEEKGGERGERVRYLSKWGNIPKKKYTKQIALEYNY